MNFICVNDTFIDPAQPAIRYDDRSYRYGDGFFETMKIYNGHILLSRLHKERFFNTASLLNIKLDVRLNWDVIQTLIHQLFLKNQLQGFAKTRLSVSRPPYDKQADFIITCEQLPVPSTETVKLGLYTEARKSNDLLSNLKTSSFLPYALAEQHAVENGYDECLLCNFQTLAADTNRSNIFIIEGDTIFTPSPEQGCIDGVFKRFLLENQSHLPRGWRIVEQPLSIERIKNSEEIFLTNSVRGIRSVESFSSIAYSNTNTLRIKATVDQLLHKEIVAFES